MRRARLPDPPLLVITDRRRARLPLDEVATAAFAAGCRWLLIREKDLAQGDLVALARGLVALGGAVGAEILVSGDVAAVRAAGAAGVHLPRDGDPAAARADLGPDALIGLSAHDLAEARRAESLGVDYVTLSPVFESVSKPGYGPDLGLANLGQIARALTIPVLALGGIEAPRIPGCLAAGAAGAAVMGAVMGTEAPDAAVDGLVRALRAKELDSSG